MDLDRSLRNRLSRERGAQFEAWINESFEYYKERGFAAIEKTPEPMKPIKSLGEGKFIAVYTQKAQTDYKGTIKGGRTVIFEAKYTDADRLEQSRVRKNQEDYMKLRSALGARCWVLAGFRSGEVYKIPWEVWTHMKETFGRKYVTEADVQGYKVRRAFNGVLLILG